MTVTTPEPGSANRILRATGLLFVLLGLLSMTFPASAQNGGSVHLVEIHGTIDLGLAPFLERAIEDAEEANAAALVMDINTPGGRLDATFQMRDALLDAEIPTMAFVDGNAFSAGALISIAAEHVYMTPGSTIGAATPVTGTGETADEKNVSAVRSAFRSTAESRGRDPDVAEAMVDPSVEVEGLVNDEQLVSMTPSEALEWDISDGTVDSLDQALAEIGLEGSSVQQVSQSWAESVVRLLTEPVIASLLFSIGSLLIVFDIFSGDISPLSGAGIALLALFFWGHYIAGLAGWEGILLVLLGLALIAVEIFIIPGFGVFGILGLVSLGGGLFISVIGDVTVDSDLRRAAYTVGGAMVLMLVGIVLLFIFLPAMTRFRGLVLHTTVGEDAPMPPEPGYRRWFQRGDDAQPEGPAVPAMPSQPSLVGQRGRALSDLRPGGFARINNMRVDVVTQGDYIQAGDLVEVVADDRYRRVVVLVDEQEESDQNGASDEA